MKLPGSLLICFRKRSLRARRRRSIACAGLLGVSGFRVAVEGCLFVVFVVGRFVVGSAFIVRGLV